MLSLLTECTILMLRVLYEMYKEQRITYREFLNFTQVKIKFLLENLDKMSTDDERRNANHIIEQCSSLITRMHGRADDVVIDQPKKNGHQVMDAYYFSTDIIQ